MSTNNGTISGGIIINIGTDSAPDAPSGGGKVVRAVWYDETGDSAILTLTRTAGPAGDEYAISGFASTAAGFIGLEWPAFTMRIAGWQQGVNLLATGSGRAPGSVIYTYKGEHGGQWTAEITVSEDGAAHRVDLVDPDGRKGWFITYDNAAPIVWVGLAALYCLGSAIILSLVTDCTEECGGKPKKVRIAVTFMNEFPYLPVCGKECIC